MVDEEKLYSLDDAVALVKKFPAPKFDSTVTLSFKLGVDPKQSDQMVRGACALPHGSGADVRVAVFADGEAAIAAKNAGAEHVGMDDLIKKVKEGFTDFDVAVATPAAMAEVRKLGRVLGPRGLMPNPKTGTVTDDTAKAIAEVKAGRIDFKVDRNSNIAMRVGKLSFTEDQLMDNAKAVLEVINGVRPSSSKGIYMQSVTLAATMTPGVHLDAGALGKA